MALHLCLPTPSTTPLSRPTGHDPVRSAAPDTHSLTSRGPHVQWKHHSSAKNHCSVSSALQDLQGEVESYILTVDSAQTSHTKVLGPEIISTVISDLWPSTSYQLSLLVSNGAHNTTKATLNVTTEDGGTYMICFFNIILVKMT